MKSEVCSPLSRRSSPSKGGVKGVDKVSDLRSGAIDYNTSMSKHEAVKKRREEAFDFWA